VIAGLVLLLILGALIFYVRSRKPVEPEETTTVAEETLPRGSFRGEASLDLGILKPEGEADSEKYTLALRGRTAEEVLKYADKLYSWGLSVVNEDADVGNVVKPTVDATETTEAATMGDAEHPDGIGLEGESDTPLETITVAKKIQVPNIIDEELEDLLGEIFAADAEKLPEGKVFKLELKDADARVEAVAEEAATMWYKAPKGASIGSYDKEKDEFIIEGEEDGFEINKDKLIKDLKAALDEHRYEDSIPVEGSVLTADLDASVGEYKILASFTTRTTNVAVRNKNISLACNTLNGTIVRPGEEFSFNDTVGQRTTEKGYGPAGAYNNGEVVQEIGGGVCQVSTTLYNAILRAGLKITKRQSHTFEPSYVTPGMDATVSWGGPDFRFANVPSIADYSYDETYAIGIRAWYKDRTVNVTIYGRPVLKPGYRYDLQSKRLSTIPMVRVQIAEDDPERKPASGSEGSTWETRLVIKKDEDLVSNEVDHKTYYSGHTEYFVETTPATDENGLSDQPIMPAGPGEEIGGPSGGSIIVSTTAAQTNTPIVTEPAATAPVQPAPPQQPTQDWSGGPGVQPSGGGTSPGSGSYGPGFDGPGGGSYSQAGPGM